MAKIDLASNSALLSVGDKLEEQNAILAAIAGNEGALPVKSWSAVQAIVRMGLAPKIFSVGDTLTCNHSEFGELVWDIVGFDCDRPTDNGREHSMTLMLHDCSCIKLPFSEPEAMIYCSEQFPAGTYWFKIPKTSLASEVSYQFTTEYEHQNPNVIFFDYSKKKVIIYNDPTYGTVSETLSVSKGSSGTFLGTCDGTKLNSAPHIIAGNESWKASDIRQWLSSDAAAGEWWKYSDDKGMLSHPPSYSGRAGFLNGIDADFAAALGSVVKRTNGLTASGCAFSETEDIVFLPSISELSGGYEKCGDEGNAYPYFSEYSDNLYPSDKSDSNRVKTDSSGFGSSYRVRSAYLANEGGTVWSTGSSGEFNTYGKVSFDVNIVPMCCIV